ncbi:hypothetical protein K1719_003411 [Acacia pycnantha]|nr:hypothetical protein K1719_003411 [Acacia pycnantha]
MICRVKAIYYSNQQAMSSRGSRRRLERTGGTQGEKKYDKLSKSRKCTLSVGGAQSSHGTSTSASASASASSASAGERQCLDDLEHCVDRFLKLHFSLFAFGI